MSRPTRGPCAPVRRGTFGCAAWRYGIDGAEATRHIAAEDDGVRARMRQMFDVDWTDPLLYDLVINTAAVGQVLGLVSAAEFPPSRASRQPPGDRRARGRS